MKTIEEVKQEEAEKGLSNDIGAFKNMLSRSKDDLMNNLNSSKADLMNNLKSYKPKHEYILGNNDQLKDVAHKLEWLMNNLPKEITVKRSNTIEVKSRATLFMILFSLVSSVVLAVGIYLITTRVMTDDFKEGVQAGKRQVYEMFPPEAKEYLRKFYPDEPEFKEN